jgi:hypothetical protein
MNRQAIYPLRNGHWFDGCLGVEPRGMRSLWLKDSAIWWKSYHRGHLLLGETGRATFQLYPGICLTYEEKHGKPHDKQLVLH